MSKICPNCHAELRDDAKFCSTCGTAYPEKTGGICPNCQSPNRPEAKFCQRCGSPLTPPPSTQETSGPVQGGNAVTPPPAASTVQPAGTTPNRFQAFLQKPQARYGALAIFALLIAFAGAFYYYHYMSESHYLAQYAEASRKIEAANEVLTSNIKADSLKPDKTADIQKQLQEQKGILDNIQKELSKSHAPKKYTQQQENLLALLDKENSILEETGLAITKPLDKGTDDVIKSVKSNVEAAKSLAAQLDVPNASFDLNSDLSTIPHQLTLYVEDQRKANREKMQRLTAMQDFFQKMDNAIQKYNGGKTDLGSLLTNLRQGGYTWFDYFSALQEARSLRSGLRFQIVNLKTPTGTEGLKTQFLDVLTTSLQYCDMMSAGAHMEFDNDFGYQEKYDAADKINKKVQSSYGDFIKNYNSEKERLTNIDNL